MAETLLTNDFTWRVAASGYQALTTNLYFPEVELSQRPLVEGYRRRDFPAGDYGHQTPALFIAERRTREGAYYRSDASGYRRYRLGDPAMSGLFRTFAATDRSPEGMMHFVSRFGLPDRGHYMVVSTPAEDEGPFVAAPHADLAADAYAMAVAVGLWDLIRNGRQNQLEGLFAARELPPGTLQFCPDDAFGPPPSQKLSPDPIEIPPSSMLVWARPKGPSYSSLPVCLRAALEVIERVTTENLRSGARLGMSYRDEGLGLAMKIEPLDLLGAMWLQFAQAFSRNTTFQECPGCGAWFERSPSVGRADKKYCSTRCRTRMHKQRQAEALRMAAAGSSAQQISRQLGVPAATVRRWLSANKGGKSDA